MDRWIDALLISRKNSKTDWFQWRSQSQLENIGTVNSWPLKVNVWAETTPGCRPLEHLSAVNCKQNHTRRLNLHCVCVFREINNCARRDTFNEAACVSLQRRDPKLHRAAIPPPLATRDSKPLHGGCDARQLRFLTGLKSDLNFLCRANANVSQQESIVAGGIWRSVNEGGDDFSFQQLAPFREKSEETCCSSASRGARAEWLETGGIRCSIHLVWERLEVPDEELEMAARAKGMFWNNLLSLLQPWTRVARWMARSSRCGHFQIIWMSSTGPSGETAKEHLEKKWERGWEGGILKNLEVDWTVTLSIIGWSHSHSQSLFVSF